MSKTLFLHGSNKYLRLQPFFRKAAVFGLAAVFILGAAVSMYAQRGRTGEPLQGHLLYGDLKIENRSGGKIPMSFMVVLYSISGTVVGRQTIGNNGRYRFENVPNGEWEIAVEAENSELARTRFLLNESRFTDIRKDLALVWEGLPGAKAPTGGSVAVGDVYERKPEAQGRMEKALEESSKKNYRQAGDLLKQIVAADPGDFEAWAELGTVEFLQNKHGEAEKAYKRSLEEKPGYAVALLNLGKLQFAQKKFDEAIASLGSLVEKQPSSAEAHFFLGESYLQVKKGSKAVIHLEEALRLDPVGKADAHLRLGTLYNAAGMKERAAAEYEKFLAKIPDHPEKKKLQQYIGQNRRP